MSTHETIVRDEAIEPGSDRSFGLIVGGILLAISLYLFFTASQSYLWFAVPGFLLLVSGALLPSILRPLNRAWTSLGVMLGRIVTPIVMFLVYAVSIVPIGLLLRLFGKDLLTLKKGAAKSSYWIERLPPGPAPDSLKDQF